MIPDVRLYLTLLIRLVESNINTSHLSPDFHEIRIGSLRQATTTTLYTLQTNFELLIDLVSYSWGGREVVVTHFIAERDSGLTPAFVHI